jgi:hypothetical protein
MGTQTQHKARLQVGCPNATQGTSASWAPQHTSATQTQGTSTMQGMSNRPQFGHHNTMQVTSPRWSPKRKTHPQQKHPHKGGWIRTNFSLEVDFLIRPHQGWVPQRNARHVRKMGAQTQHETRPQVGRPNATQGTSASWAPQRTSAMQGTSARPQVGHPNTMQGTSARWLPKRKTHPQ